MAVVSKPVLKKKEKSAKVFLGEKGASRVEVRIEKVASLLLDSTTFVILPEGGYQFTPISVTKADFGVFMIVCAPVCVTEKYQGFSSFQRETILYPALWFTDRSGWQLRFAYEYPDYPGNNVVRDRCAWCNQPALVTEMQICVNTGLQKALESLQLEVRECKISNVSGLGKVARNVQTSTEKPW